MYPSLGWWSGKGLAGASSIPTQTGTCLEQFAGHALNTDWGLRDVSNDEKIYDGMSYHQGSVWPLFTGWAALAEYRANQPLAGYQLLMENANLTKAQDLGAVTELLSGDFFVPFGRSTSHQLWSSAMVITPTLRGLFGIDIDAQTKTITVNPHLPASWDNAQIRQLILPGGTTTLNFERVGRELLVSLTNADSKGWKLRSDLENAKPVKSDGPSLSITTPEIEVDQLLSGFQGNLLEKYSGPDKPPNSGARTSRFRILDSTYADHKLVLTFDGVAGTQATVALIRHELIVPRANVDKSADGAEAIISAKDGWSFKDRKAPLLLVVTFPPGEGWKTITVTLTW